MASIYTDALVLGLKKLAADGPVTFAAAEAFAAANGLKTRSVVAKIRSMKLAYVPKPVRVTKAGEPVVLKASLVTAVEVALGVKVPTLAKVSKEDLVQILAGVGKIAGFPDEAEKILSN